jgi:hypothetical protein
MMRKLKLELDSLVVETFETGGAGTSSATAGELGFTVATSGGPYFCPDNCASDEQPCTGAG